MHHAREIGYHGPAQKAQNDLPRQRDGIDQQDGTQMLLENADLLALNRAGKANAERVSGEFQWWLLRRAFDRETVFNAVREPRENHCMEGGLQPTQAPLIPRKSHAAGVLSENKSGNQGRMRRKLSTDYPNCWREVGYQVTSTDMLHKSCWKLSKMSLQQFPSCCLDWRMSLKVRGLV